MTIFVEVLQIAVDTQSIYPRLKIWTEFSEDERTSHQLLLNIGDLIIISAKSDSKIISKVYPNAGFLTVPSSSIGSICSIEYHADLDYYRLEQIEKLREGGNLNFTVNVSATEIRLSKTVQGFSISSPRIVIKYPGNRTSYEIAKSKWCEEFLPQLGYKKVRLVEIPILVSPPEEFKEAVDMIEKAWKDYSMGEYEDVLTDCRKALEPVSDRIKKDGFKKDEINEKGEKQEVPDWKRFLGGHETLGESFEKMFRGTRSFSTLGAHVGSTISRSEAECALMSTYSIINYVIKKYLRKAQYKQPS